MAERKRLMSQNNLKVFTPSRILSLWNASVREQRLHRPACHILWHVSTPSEVFFLQLQHTAILHCYINASADASSRKQAKIKFDMMYLILYKGALMRARDLAYRKPVQSCSIHKAIPHVCAFPQQQEELCVLVCQAVNTYFKCASLLLCFCNEPQGRIHKVRQIRNWKHLFSSLFCISSCASQTWHTSACPLYTQPPLTPLFFCLFSPQEKRGKTV